jgi:carbonic anhydrase
VRDKHQDFLNGIGDAEKRWARLCELNVVEQALNVARTTLVRDTWARGQPLTVHGWVYGLSDGLLHDTGFTVAASEEVEPAMLHALQTIRETT